MRSPTATPRCSASRADPAHDAEQHTARAGDRVVLLAPARHRLEDEPRHAVRAAAGGLLHLAEARGVDVQRLHIDDDLGLEVARGVGVQPLCRLRHRPRWIEHAVRAQRIACREGGSRRYGAHAEAVQHAGLESKGNEPSGRRIPR